MMDELHKLGDEPWPANDQLHTDETNQFLRKLLTKLKVECTPPLTNARMIDTLVGEYIESQCINPTFIVGHPEVCHHSGIRILMHEFDKSLLDDVTFGQV